jgi:hypothetical protein
VSWLTLLLSTLLFPTPFLPFLAPFLFLAMNE